MNVVIGLNIDLLGQAITLVREQSNEAYCRCCDEVFSSSIGQHVRHCVEHYEVFLLALNEGRELDYEKRPRDPKVETDAKEAVRRMERIRDELASFKHGLRELGVRDTGTASPAPSSTAREMQYLVSHTVHHFALIAVIASIQGIRLVPNFGIAPSTLKYRESV